MNPNEPAFARPVSMLSQEEVVPEQNGLTKRELFAAMAMQGLCAVPDPDINPTTDYEDVANMAVKYADALIAELNKEKQ